MMTGKVSIILTSEIYRTKMFQKFFFTVNSQTIKVHEKMDIMKNSQYFGISGGIFYSLVVKN